LRQVVQILVGLAVALVVASTTAAVAKRKAKLPAAAAATAAAAVPATTADAGRTARSARLAAVKSWGYQLRQITPAEIAASPEDLVVIDYSNDRRYYMEWPLPAADIATMQTRPDGQRRVVLSYLSIGEAEDYRNYWQWEWMEDPANRPSWLGKENPDWEGNYPVRFWQPGWQSIIYGGPEKYLDSIIRAGFDGVYLDRVDVFSEWTTENPKAEAEMVKFLDGLAAYARRIKPDFLIIIQNGEELVRHATVRRIIDGVAKESLFYGLKGPDSRNPDDDIRSSLDYLRIARNAGGLILLVEYAKSVAARSEITRLAAAEGFPLLQTHRDLGDANHAEKPPGSPTSPRGNN
jgi:cysteinyl-tRNA synthetase, unknown class